MQGWFNIWNATLIIHIIKIKEKNLAIISINAEKALVKIQYTFVIKNSKQTKNGREFPQFNKEHLWKTYS